MCAFVLVPHQVLCSSFAFLIANFGVLDDGLYGDEAAELELEGIATEW